jgi:hypothetical protein
MSATFRLNADDLNSSILEKIQTLFRHKDIEITVSEEDATEILRSDPADHARLLQSIEQLKNREGLIELDPKYFQ